MKFLERIKLNFRIKKKFNQLFQISKYNIDENNIILLEFSNWTISHILSSYVCNILSKKHKATVHAYPGWQITKSEFEKSLVQKIKWKIGNFFSINYFGIYNSFGVKKIFWPNISSKQNIKIIKEFKNFNNKIKSNEDLQNYKIKNILIGDLIYDSYLKKYLYPTININSKEFKFFAFEAIKLYFFWDEYFRKSKISSVVAYHCVYLSALPLRFAIKKNIPSYVLNVENFYRLNKKRIFIGLEYLDYRKNFNLLSSKVKKISLSLAKKKLESRLKGKQTSDMVYMSKTAYGKKIRTNVLKKSNKIKILIAPSSFCDSPHCFGNNLFIDGYDWLQNLGNISNNTNYDWYIKCHPDFATYFDNTISIVKKFVKKYPKIKYLNANTSHNQIISEGIDYVLTIYGSISGEYPYFGVNAVNASLHNTQKNYDFTITPKSKKDYIKFLENLKKPKKINKKKQILEHYFMKYEYYNNQWFFDDLNKVKKNINGYTNFTKIKMYEYWLNNFDFNEHKMQYEKIENFINSNNYVLVNKKNYT